MDTSSVAARFQATTSTRHQKTTLKANQKIVIVMAMKVKVIGNSTGDLNITREESSTS